MYKASVDLQLPYVRLTARESTAGESGFIPALVTSFLSRSGVVVACLAMP